MSIKETFCILPFTHLATHPDGKVTPCCESKFTSKHLDKDLELGINTVEEIRNSKNFKALRKQMLEGKFHTSCDFCYDREKAGLVSKRIRENTKYEVDYNNIDKYKDLPLMSVELRLGNVCNAKCVICHPGSSSKWNEDITEEIQSIDSGYNKRIIENTWFRDDKFYDNVLNYSNDIVHLWFNGGEPLLIKEHLKFLNKLVELNVTDKIELEYHTNGSLITTKILDIWKNFKNLKITLSLDDIETRFHYARYPLTFDTVENSIKLLRESNIHYDIIPTVNLLNVTNTTGIYEYFKFNYDKECIFNYLRFPKFQSIVNMPDHIKKRILSNSRLPEHLHTQLEYEFYADNGMGLTKALNFYNALDRQRGLKIEEYLPEFVEYINYDRDTNIII